jgi:hypothetical protein
MRWLFVIGLIVCFSFEALAQEATIDSLRIDSLLHRFTSVDGGALCSRWCESPFSSDLSPYSLMNSHLAKSVQLSTRTADKLIASNSGSSWHQLVIEKLIWTDAKQLTIAKRYARKIVRICDSLQVDEDADTSNIYLFLLKAVAYEPDMTTEREFKSHIRFRFGLQSKEEEDFVIKRIADTGICNCLSYVRGCSEARRIASFGGISEHVYDVQPVGQPQLK